MASMGEKRRALANAVAERNRQGRGVRLLKRSLVAVVALLLLSAAGLWCLGFFSTPAAVAELKRLVDQQVAEYDRVARGEAAFSVSAGPAALFANLREAPPAYREQVGRQMGRLWEARERAECGSYFALPPQQRLAELDRRIRSEEERRRQLLDEREKRARERGESGGQQPVAGDRGRGGGPPGGGRGGSTEESRNARMKRRLDTSTPDERARQAEYRRALDARRAQLGLAPGNARRGG